MLQRIIGGLDDVLATPDGRRIGRLGPVFKGRRTIREAQLVQESGVTVRIVPGPDDTDDFGLAVVKELEARLGPAMRMTVQFVAGIERTAGGKFRAVVNQWPRPS